MRFMRVFIIIITIIIISFKIRTYKVPRTKKYQDLNLCLGNSKRKLVVWAELMSLDLTLSKLLLELHT